ncbi:Ig-like domain-containing protein [Marinomonas transparens]|uniref:Uncharacterized protein n=1 Tax=Marinomonas transparens TaxID=2795388 RepID=A0A934JZ79_9GAMM|nr:Ig-like domain-containing protein [Marinomonas transparens]MBJ7539824.1 hypothetical protein [Marinomonas transparens]
MADNVVHRDDESGYINGQQEETTVIGHTVSLVIDEDAAFEQAKEAFYSAFYEGKTAEQALQDASDRLDELTVSDELKVVLLNLLAEVDYNSLQQLNAVAPLNIVTDCGPSDFFIEEFESSERPIFTKTALCILVRDFNKGEVAKKTDQFDFSTVISLSEEEGGQGLIYEQSDAFLSADLMDRTEQTLLSDTFSMMGDIDQLITDSLDTMAETQNVTVMTPNFTVTNDAGQALVSGDRTNAISLVISGSSEAGSTVKIYNGLTELGDATVEPNGAWSYTATIINGIDYHFNAKATDVAGNESAATSNFSVTADTIAPDVSIDTVTDDMGSVTGTLASGDITDDTNLVLSGTVEAGSKVKIYNGSTELGDANVASNGTWSYTAVITHDMRYQFNAKATDAAGNESVATENFGVTVDAVAPDVAIAAVTDDVGSIQGALTSGSSTDDTNLLLSGTAEAGSTVKIYNGITVMGDATVESNGNWTYSATLVNGNDYQLNAKATDAVGNESAATSNFSVTADTTILAPEFTVMDDVGSVTGLLSSEVSTDDTSLLLSGKTEAGATVKIYEAGNAVGDATVDSSGNWTYNATLVNGNDYQFSAKATDAVGNESDATLDFNVTADTTAPDVSIDTVTDDMGSVTGTLTSGDITDDTNLVLSGTVEAGSRVKVYNGETEVGNATVDSNGNWTYSATLVNGNNYQFNAKATDAAGNESAATSNFSVTADMSAPDVAMTSVTDDVGSIQGALTSGSSTDDTTLLLSGTAEAGSTVKIYNGITVMGDATVESNGNWTYSATLVNGNDYQLNAKATDAVGNESAATSYFSVTADTVAPMVYFSKAIDDVGKIKKQLVTGDVTDDTSLALSGATDDPSSTVTVYDGTTKLGEATVMSNGLWSYTAEISDGVSYQFNVKATDAAGNEGVATATFNITGDTKGPEVTLGLTDDVGNVQGSLTSGDTTDDTRTQLSGKVEAGSKVEIYNDGVLTAYGLVTGDDWSSTVSLENGTTYNFTVIATDAAGNESELPDFTVTSDTVAPVAATSNPLVWDMSKGVSNTVLDAGDTVTITFSEVVKVADLQLSDFTLTDSHSWGTGATLSTVDDDSDGYSNIYTITLGSGSTATEEDKVTIAAGEVNDKAGNTNQEIGLQVDTSIVVFDLVAGTSSSHSARTFDANVSYTIYIKVDSNSEKLNFSSGSKWLSGENLGADDKIVLVGDDAEGVHGGNKEQEITQLLTHASYLAWADSRGLIARGSAKIYVNGSFFRAYGAPTGAKGAVGVTNGRTSRVDLWDGMANAGNSGQNPGKGQVFSTAYADQLPTSIAATQPMF